MTTQEKLSALVDAYIYQVIKLDELYRLAKCVVLKGMSWRSLVYAIVGPEAFEEAFGDGSTYFYKD